jgi:trehalose 6-phosphate phosphatase
VFDFDGTLAPIVADRTRADMRPATAERLARLCRAVPCAILSGRSRDDVAGRLGAAIPAAIIGNHGIEEGDRETAFAGVLRPVRAHLVAALDGPGVELEDKRCSLALHLRGPRAPALRRKAEEVLAAHAREVRVFPGKRVLNIVPAGAPHKGDALRSLLARAGADRGIYAGDDATDEDAFRMCEPGVLGVRIGRNAASAAQFYLRHQLEVDGLLDALLANFAA